jgi:predicted Rossmann fold nucleotide-binding protein DprA/Smf involved in DNA uptake
VVRRIARAIEEDMQPKAKQGTTEARFRIAIIGSRTFSNTKMLAKIMEEYVGRATLIVSGGADGADKIGARWARKNGVPTKIFEPDRKRYKHAYHHRNRLIVENCDLVVAFWDGRSTGTEYTIGYARKLGVEVRIVKF